MSKWLRGITIALAIGFVTLGPRIGLAQTKPAVTSLGPDYPKTAIFIGNSFFYYNNGVPGILSQMEKAVDPANKLAYRNTMVTIGGSGFDWHDVESYFRPNAIGSYSFDDDNNVVFNKLDKLFDVAVMMDCSQVGVHRLCEEEQRHRPRQGHETRVLHVLGLCRQTRDDRAAGRGLYGGGQCQ
jgi:hypothetical protein